MHRRRWKDLTPRQKFAVRLAGAVQLSLALAAWFDLARRPARQVRGPKGVWAVAIGLNFVGPPAYFRWGRLPR